MPLPLEAFGRDGVGLSLPTTRAWIRTRTRLGMQAAE
jgi:hypothetical protein